MSIVFFGTPSFAVPTLEALLNSSYNVSLVITQPDKEQGRGRQVIFSPIKKLALQKGINLLQPKNLKDKSTIDRIVDCKPDFIVTIAYGKILPIEILQIPKYGAINVHASLLPKYRGAAPIQWALINGDETTGVTTMMMDEGLDTGDMLLKTETKITENDNAETLSKRLSEMGAGLLLETIRGLKIGIIESIPQSGDATYARPVRKEDGLIDWQKSAYEIFNLTRGLYIWPNTYSFYKGLRTKFFKVRVLKGDGIAGRIEDISQGMLIVGTGKGLLAIEELQVEGKKRMSSKDFISGREIDVKNDYFI